MFISTSVNLITLHSRRYFKLLRKFNLMSILIKFTLFDVKAHTLSKGFIFDIVNILTYSPKYYYNISI